MYEWHYTIPFFRLEGMERGVSKENVSFEKFCHTPEGRGIFLKNFAMRFKKNWMFSFGYAGYNKCNDDPVRIENIWEVSP